MEGISYHDTLRMRRHYVGKGCWMHFETAPLRIVRASKQYVYDDSGNEFLDCVNNASHVGHCHPHVVNAGQEQMGKLMTSNGFLNDVHSLYAKRLVETLPDSLCVCYFVNSGSEASDLALRLARSYTGREDVMVIDNTFHGNLGQVLDVSPLHYKRMGLPKKDYVHVVPCPDTYRGKHREDCLNPGERYIAEVRECIQEAEQKGRQIGAFLSEPLLTNCGIVTCPQHYLKHVYSAVRESGGVCIADEVQTGLGRTGEGYWAFQAEAIYKSGKFLLTDVVPDIVTCGKHLGNGHPMAAVVTTKAISETLGEFISACAGNPVSCALGMAVLDVIGNEKLISSARCVGQVLKEGFRGIQSKHPMLGDIRGTGLLVGVDIVSDKKSRLPAREAADLLTYKLRQQKILVGTTGMHRNVMTLTPPMCFTCDNARHVVKALDEALSEIERGVCPDQLGGLNIVVDPCAKSSNLDLLPLDVISENVFQDPDDKGDNDDGDPDPKKARYEDVD